jgi:hypothetical protein
MIIRVSQWFLLITWAVPTTQVWFIGEGKENREESSFFQTFLSFDTKQQSLLTNKGQMGNIAHMGHQSCRSKSTISPPMCNLDGINPRLSTDVAWLGIIKNQIIWGEKPKINTVWKFKLSTFVHYKSPSQRERTCRCPLKYRYILLKASILNLTSLPFLSLNLGDFDLFQELIPVLERI